MINNQITINPMISSGCRRHLSTSESNDNDDQSLSSLSSSSSPPEILTSEMALGIAKTIQFYIQYGMAYRQLQQLSLLFPNEIVVRWQKMMEIYLMTQVHVLAGMGYESNERGLTQFATDVMNATTPRPDTPTMLYDEDTIQSLQHLRRSTWRDLVSISFDLSSHDIRELSIVEARNIMHAVASQMIEPNILQLVEHRIKDITLSSNDDQSHMTEEEKQYHMTLRRHTTIQDIIVNYVYLANGGQVSDSLLEKYADAYGGNIRTDTPGQLYAKLQCSISDYDGDPLMTQYVTSSMSKLWHIAGLTNSTTTNSS